MGEVTLMDRNTYKVTWKDSVEWVQIIFVFTLVNWLFALLSSLPTIIILQYYHLQSYIGTALAGYAIAYTAFILRNWNIIAQFVASKIETEDLDHKVNLLSLVLIGTTVTIYSLIGIILHSEWLPFIIALLDYYILEKKAWYISIVGWINMIILITTRAKKTGFYKTIPIGFIGLALLLRTLKRF